jgi:hypothetical protein
LLKGHLERDIRLDYVLAISLIERARDCRNRRGLFSWQLEISKERTLGDSIEKFVERGRDQGAPRPTSVASDEKL